MVSSLREQRNTIFHLVIHPEGAGWDYSLVKHQVQTEQSRAAHPSQEANQQGWLLATVQVFPAKH